MSTVTTVLQTTGLLLATAAVLLFFKPLLLGVCRALALVVHPRLNKEQLAARRNMHDAKMLQNMINASNSAPSLTAELRAMAARS